MPSAALIFSALAGHRPGGRGIGKVFLHPQRERQIRRPNFPALGQQRFRDGHHAVFVRVGGVDDRQFILARAFGVILGVADFDAHLAFDLENLRQELPAQQQNQAGVNEDDPDFLARETESV